MIPNFFILGAPKCGTTALYEYLRTHPAVFMPRLKEPHFFAEDLPGCRVVRTREDYLRLFVDAAPTQTAVGEASVYYLHSAVAARRLLEWKPDAKLVVMLRNPLQMFPSLHAEFVYGCWDDERDPAQAWRLQAARREGRSIPRACPQPDLLQYQKVCSLGAQVQALSKVVAPGQLCALLFDDFCKSPGEAYHRVLSHLGLPSDGRTEFPKVNERKASRVGWVGRLLQAPPLLQGLRERLKRELYVKQSWTGKLAYAALQAVRGRNLLSGTRETLDPEFREELAAAFRPDIGLLSELLRRDLSHWHSQPAADRKAA